MISMHSYISIASSMFNTLTIQQAAEGLRKGEFSVTQLLSHCLGAIRERDPHLKSFLTLSEDTETQAEERDTMLENMSDVERARLPALFGIPIAVKDNIMVEGMRCTAGSKVLKEYTASYDATVITRLKAAGAIVLGKTNLDEFAMGSSTENSAYGPTKNPRDMTRVPGGSSGGSAAAVAGSLCVAALGSDTGGSIRQPASFCGVVGLKPTYGSVSRHGLIAMASSLDQIGPITKTVEDARILFEAIRGGDAFDATSVGEFNQFKESERELINSSTHQLKNLKIGVPKEYFGDGLDPDVAEAIKNAIDEMRRAGADVKDISLPHSRFALPAYYVIVPSEVSANLARFDGIRYGHSVAAMREIALYDVYARSRSEGLGPEVKRRIMLGTYALSAGYYDAYYAKAQKVRRLIRDDFARAFEEVDIIAGPTTPSPAFRIGERTDDVLSMYLADIYTVAINLAGLPALSLPVGEVAREGVMLPVGLQLIGAWHKELKILAAADALEALRA